VYTPASYGGGLTFLTGSDDSNAGSEFPIVVSAFIVAVGGGYILWRRNGERPTGRHRRHGASSRHLRASVRS
jgi:hypothetical protein